MDFEEHERRRRRQLIKVVIAEIGMFASVVAIVVIATLAAMGFFVNSDGSIEQMGLTQIHSMPTGGTVEIDGGVVFSRTNMSRSLAAGDHQIKIWRDKYDTWEKTVRIYPGLLTRLYYPRLFLKDRKQEIVANLGQDMEFYAPSLDATYILYAEQDSLRWQLMNIKGDDLNTTVLDMTNILPGVKDKKFLGKIEELKWSKNSDYVLARVSYGAENEWILVNLRDVKQSLNLTRTFGLNFIQVEMIDDSASQLYALENGNLRRINTSNQVMSRVLLGGVRKFANENTNVVYVTSQMVGVYRDNEKDGTKVADLKDGDNVEVAVSKYLDAEYMAFVINQKLTVYYGSLPVYREKVEETDFTTLKALIEDAELTETPTKMSVSFDDEFILAQNGQSVAVIDLEMGDVAEYVALTERVSWLADGMLTTVMDGELRVWDFDNTNQRVLVKAGTSVEKKADEESTVTTTINAQLVQLPPVITSNDKWLYYVVYDKNTIQLARERVRE